MRQDRQPGGNRIAVHLCSEAPMAVQKTLQLCLGMMESAGAGPAIGTAEYRFVAMIAFDPCQFGANKLQGPVPGNRDEGLAAACLAIPAWTVFEPSLAHHRFGTRHL